MSDLDSLMMHADLANKEARMDAAAQVEQRYNGWTNYETWNVALHINNDEGLYLAARDYASSVLNIDSHLAPAEGDGPTYRGFLAHFDGLHRHAGDGVLLGGMGGPLTPDGVHWLDSGLDYDELDEMIREFREEG